MNQDKTNLGKETEQVEFKKSTGELKEGVISIASILNKHESGDLYFGVKNNGDVIGQDISDTTLRDVSQAIRGNIKPAVYPVVEEETYSDRSVVHVHFEGKRRPYTAYNIPRIRVADEDAVMDQETFREMMNARENRTDSWETKPSKYHIRDIDTEILSDYLQKAKEAGRISFRSTDPESVMAKLELSDGDTLLNAGAALFVNCGINELQLAKFASDERLTFNDIKRYTGSIFDLADKAVQYVADAMDWRVVFDGSLERKEFPEVPVPAVREAVINAFGHRVIESMQAVEVAIYKSYIDIYSPGTFPDHVTPQQFITEDRKPVRRNPLITRTLYYSKDMEAFATGLKRIHDACAEAGVNVEFLRDEYGFTVRFHRHCGDGWNTVSRPNLALFGKGPEKGPETKADEIVSRSEAVLGLIKENPMISRQEMAKTLNLSEKQIRISIDRLKKAGIIRYEGSFKSGRWIIDREP